MSLFIHLLFFPIHKIIIINIFSIYIKKKIICFWLRRVSVAAQGLLSSCSEQGLHSTAAPGLLPGTVSLQWAGAALCHSAWAPHWDGFSAVSRGCALPQSLGFSLGRFLCSKQGLCSATVPGLLTGTVSLQRAGVVLCHSAWAPHWDGFSCCGAWALGCVGFSGCNMQAQ